MRFLLLPTAMFLLAATAPAQQKIELQEYTSKDGKYKIRIPGKPTETAKEVEAGGKKIPMQTASLQLEGKEKRAVVLTSLELDQPFATGAEPAAVERLAKAATKKGKVLTDVAITFGKDKLPGRDMLVESADHHMRYRAVLSGKRIYQLMILGPKDFVASKDAEAILDSFEVTK